MFEIKERNESISQENVQENLNSDSSELLFNELSEDLAEIINGGHGGSCHQEQQLYAL